MSNEQKQQELDHFTRLMFGQFPPKGMTPQNTQQKEHVDSNTPEANIDFAQIMNHVDGIMNSINQLKPMIKQMTPLLELFKKNKNN